MQYLRNKFINFIVKHLYNGIFEEDILRFVPDAKGHCEAYFEDSNAWAKCSVFYKGKKLTDEQVLRLQEDAEKFTESVIWKLLTDDAKYQANLIMYDKSGDYGGMMFGKAMLYNVDILNKRLRQLSKLKT